MSERPPGSGRKRALAAAFAATAALAGAACNAGGGGSDWQQYSVQRQIAGEQELAVTVAYGAGRFAVQPADGNTLYAVEMSYDADVFQPRVEYAPGRLDVGVEGGRRVRGRNLGNGYLRLGLSPAVVTDLDLQFGAVLAEIELGGLSLRRLAVGTGASETKLAISTPNRISAESARIQAGAARFQARGLGNLNVPALSISGGVGDILLDFTGDWSTDMRTSIDVGFGALVLELPRGLGVQINRSGVLSGFEGQELLRRGDTYYSADWESAARRLTIDLNAAVGSVRIAWVGDARNF